MLSLSAFDQPIEIFSCDSLIHFADRVQCAPQGGFALDAQRQCFKSFEGSETPVGAALKLQSAHLFRNPSCGYFHVKGLFAYPFDDSQENLLIVLHLSQYV